jgi:DNA-binding NarL/FixJ family response regulator
MKKILIADDHNIVRTGLVHLIRKELDQTQIDECRDGEGVWDLLKANEYDLLILDVLMPSTDSLSLLAKIFKLRPAQKILILSVISEDIYARKYLQCGVKGFINKEASSAEVRQAIMNVLNNKKYVSPRVRDMITAGFIHGDAKNQFDILSRRELEIMTHLLEGKNVTEIARTLSLHISTVSTHKARILEKLGVSNIIELSKLAQLF